MVTPESSPDAQRRYRIDKFKVPAPARGELMEKVREAHELLRTLPGFVDDFVVEQTDGSGDSNVVTVVVWENGQALDAAREAVMAKRQATGFSPSELFARLGIEADLGVYKPVTAS